MATGPIAGISTSAFFPKPIEETLEILSHQPWRGVELMPQAPFECTPAYGRKLLEFGEGRFDFCGIHFPQILAPFLYNPHPSALEFGQQLSRSIAELAGVLGSTSIVVHGPWANMAEGDYLRATLANMRTMCEVGGLYGVTIALENTPSSPIGASVESMVSFAEQVDRPNFGFAFDVTHTYEMSQEPWPYLEGLPTIAHVHASDFDLATKRRHTAPGDGDVDWPRIIGLLAMREFNGNFILELLSSTLGEDPANTLRSAAQLLDPIFEAAYAQEAS